MTDEDQDAITEILHRAGCGSRTAVNELAPLLYERMRALAVRHLERESPGHTLQPTALVHEAYLKLVDQSRVEWQGRASFPGGGQPLDASYPGGSRCAERNGPSGKETASAWSWMRPAASLPARKSTYWKSTTHW